LRKRFVWGEGSGAKGGVLAGTGVICIAFPFLITATETAGAKLAKKVRLLWEGRTNWLGTSSTRVFKDGAECESP
jgi:hypothetical protein